MLNGGYNALKTSGIWESDSVYADSALAESFTIQSFIRRFGARKLLFGSDYPFGDPLEEKNKIIALDISKKEKNLIFSENIGNLLGIR